MTSGCSGSARSRPFNADAWDIVEANMEVFMDWFYSHGDALYAGLHSALPNTRTANYVPAKLNDETCLELRNLLSTALPVWMLLNVEPSARLETLRTRAGLHDPEETSQLMAREPRTSRRLLDAVRLLSFTWVSWLTERATFGVLVMFGS